MTLTGWIDSCQKKWAAEEAAHRVRGVKAVANDVEVRLPPAAERTDADVAAAAVRALEGDTMLRADRLHVTVSKGWGTLTGEVDWRFQKEEAERVVRRLGGRPRRHQPHHRQAQPGAVGAEAEDRAGADPQRPGRRRRISIDVQDGKVVLRGTVRSWAEWAEAERAARSASGVTAVENLITVVP